MRTSSVDIIVTDMPFGKRYQTTVLIVTNADISQRFVSQSLFWIVIQAEKHLFCSFLCAVLWQNGLKEEELGSVPQLSERDGPCVQTRLRKGCTLDSG